MEQFISTWRIENYSYCWHRVGEELVSPEFIVDMGRATVWTLSCYPGGVDDRDRDCIGFYLNRCEAGSTLGPNRIAVRFELSFQAADGTLLKSWTSNGEYEFENFDHHGVSEFVNRNEVLVEKRCRYLTEDTLIARCRMWFGSVDIAKTVQSNARTRIRVERVTFMETFGRFSEMQPGQIRSVSVKTTSEAEPAMLMDIFLETDESSEVRFVIDVVPGRKREIRVCSCDLFMLDKIGNRIQSGQSEFTFPENQSDHWQFPLSLPKTYLMDQKKEYLTLDALSLEFQFAFSAENLFEEIEETIYGRCLMTGKSIRSATPGTVSECPSALEDLKSLYKDQILCDVRLKTETQTFPAHKAVLCARSPVFRAMFANEMKENIQNCVEVEDLEYDTVRQFLLYLYTDNLEDVQWNMVSKLYYAADKYQVKALKNKCSSILIGNLVGSNACDVLLLADKHQDNDLKETVENFILENDDDVFSSDEWFSFTKSSAQLAVDTMTLMYRKKNR